MTSSLRFWLLGLMASLFLCGLVWLGRTNIDSTSGFLESTESRLVDTRFIVRGSFDNKISDGKAMKRMAEQVAIVAIDDDATHKFGRVLPRSVHGELVKKLKAAGAQAVVFDVLFTDPSIREPKEDLQFAAACRAAGNVFLPFDDNSRRATSVAEQKQLSKRLTYAVKAPRTAQVVRIRPPVEPLFEAVAGGGHVATKADGDGKFRSAILLLESGAAYPHVALDAVAQTVWGAKRGQAQLKNGFLAVGKHRFGPLERRPLARTSNFDTFQQGGTRIERAGTAWMMPLNFAGGRDTMEKITVPYLSVLDGKANDRIKGRIVIVGETATGTPDLRPGPFDTREVFLGVQTNATLIYNLLNNDFLHETPVRWDFFALLICGLSAGFLALWLRPVVAAMGVGVLIFGFCSLAMWLFATQNLIVEMTAPLLAIFLNFSALSAYRLAGSELEARESTLALRETQLVLGQMVDARLAADLTASPETRLAMQIGTRREVSVLFADVRGFTQWSETQPPEEVKARLDEYFPAMCEICGDDEDGFIDKFIGDALMVVWNAHKDQPDHAERAARSALAMQRVLGLLNEGWAKQKQAQFKIGIGIASGSVVFGTFGSPRHKLQPTILGDTVNFAARLEALTKELAPILVSATTRAALGDEFETLQLGPIPVRGKSESQLIYAVTGKKKLK